MRQRTAGRGVHARTAGPWLVALAVVDALACSPRAPKASTVTQPTVAHALPSRIDAGAGESPRRAPCCDDFASCVAALRASRDEADPFMDECLLNAARKLADAGAEGRAVARELLASTSASQRLYGAIGAGVVAPKDRDDVLPALLETYAAHHDWFVVHMLHDFRDPRTIPVMIGALSDRDAQVVTGAVVTLEALEGRAKPALSRLANVAATHWDGTTRAIAARAFNHIAKGARPIKPGPYRCPRVVRREDVEGGEAVWRVQLAKESVALRDAVPKERLLDGGAPACAGAGVHLVTMSIGEECLTADPGFECGGKIEVWRGAEPTRIAGAAPLRFVARQNDVVLLEQCGHGVPTWSLSALTRSAAGAWTHDLVTQARGHLVAHALEPDGSMHLLVRDTGRWLSRDRFGCAGRTRVENAAGVEPGDTYVLLRMDRQGVVTALE